MSIAGTFWRRGVSVMKWSTSVADPAAPTRAEIDNAVDLTPAINSIAGFGLRRSRIPTENLADEFTPSIGGEKQVTQDSALTMLDSQTTTAIRDVIAEGNEGYMFLLPYGDVAGKRMETWHSTSLGDNDQWTVGNDPARYVVDFAHPSAPEKSAVVPA